MTDNAETVAVPEQGPKLGERYKAGDLPAGSVVSMSTQAEYVIGRSGLCMRWEQPIPRSEGWRVRYEGRLPQGIWMTHREQAEVDEARKRHSLHQYDGPAE